MTQHKKMHLIGAALGWGAKRHETEFAPDVYAQAQLESLGTWHQTIYPALSFKDHAPTLDYPSRLAQIVQFNQTLAKIIQEKSQANQFCVVLGGDHAIAIGTWSGIINALGAQQQFGLLWLDAHMDANTPETSRSHAIHGMPLAVLLGYGEKALVNLMQPGAKLSPNYTVLFGVRSFEAGEAALLAALKVRIYFMEEIRDRGIALCLEEALSLVNQAPKGFGVSIDLDVFDPIEAPGVGSPEPQGIFLEGILPGLKNIFAQVNLKALEIAEYNPVLDQGEKTLKLTQKILGLF